MSGETRFQYLFGIGAGTGSRPAAGNAGARWVDTTGPTEYYDTGSTWTALGGGGGSSFDYVCVEEHQSSGTAGGTFTSGAWQTRLLNTTTADSASISSLASNQVTLPAGTYRVRASAPGVLCDQHQLRLQNITAGTTLVTGTSEFANSGASVVTRSELQGRFTLASTSALALQHQCATTRATNGFGNAASFGTEVYATIEFWKE